MTDDQPPARYTALEQTVIGIVGTIVVMAATLFFLPHMVDNFTQQQIPAKAVEVPSPTTNEIRTSTPPQWQAVSPEPAPPDCPLIDVPMTIGNSNNPLMVIRNDSSTPPPTFNGWAVRTHDTSGYITDATAWPCYRGQRTGENTNYYYCGSQLTLSGASIYIKKIYADTDGNIVKTVAKEFSNTYDANGKFLLTDCGKEIGTTNSP
jgi:hypothetical protein